MRHRFSPLLLAALGLLAVAADCESCQPTANVRQGNIDRPGDAVLVNGDDGHTYAILSNPELGHLRVLDLTIESFVPAPNRFFPLSVPAGVETRRLAVAPGDDTRVYGLDMGADQVFMVRAVEDGKEPWLRLGETVATGRAPADLGAFRSGDQVELWVSLPDEAAVEILGLDAVTGEATGQLARIALPAGSRPADVAVDPFGDSVVVADAALPLVHVLRRDTRALDRSLDVGGPVSDLAMGVVDIGDGEAPVVLASRTDANVVVALRLFRPGFREDRYEVLGSAEVPALPLVGYVPDLRESVTVCCRGFPDALPADTEDATIETFFDEDTDATDAWAAVATADGKVVYLALAAPADGDTVVRLIDKDPAPLSLRVVEEDDETWRPEQGDEPRAPVPVLTATDDFGDPPFVPLIPAPETLTLVWQGELPSLTDVSGTLAGGDTFTAQAADLEELGARAGDIATLGAADEPAGCEEPHVAPILAVDGASVTLLVGPGGLTDEDALCLAQGGAVSITVAAGDAFVVTGGDGSFLGRLTVGGQGPGGELALPGAVLTLEPSPAGPPQETGSTLLVPIDPRLGIIDLDLSDTFSTLGTGGFGAAGYMPVAIVGGEMDFPSPDATTTIRARRMLIATGSFSFEASGLNTVFVCDEAETVPALCEEFR